MTKERRLRELDFLRGIAILLVLVRHIPVNRYLFNMGWIGVDLFFVLSGFLVSGLLFKEYFLRGQVNPILFLVRRGFKIYPIYYLALMAYATLMFLNDKFYWVGFLGELFFVQNYATGFGWSFLPSWSLAVEEHFYFGLALVVYLAIKKKLFSTTIVRTTRIELILVAMMIFCLLLRIVTNLFIANSRSFTMTHLRLDSLLAGVFVSYMYYFRFDDFMRYFEKYRKAWIPLVILFVSFTPFVEDSVQSYFVKTFGFTLLYVSFAMLLAYFLFVKEMNLKLNKTFTRSVVTAISKIGVASYPIYIFHMLVIDGVNHVYLSSTIVNFLLSFSLSIAVGIGISMSVESYFLKLRDKYFPSRIAQEPAGLGSPAK
jgi:peptidoglycan/LPS O-acetylase OafA/YrhL